MMRTASSSNGVCALAALALALGLALGCGQPSRPTPEVIAADSSVALVFVDELGDAFALIGVEAQLDGRPVDRRPSAEGDAPDQPQRFRTLVVPAGEHELRLHAVYRGVGHGVFSYLKDYNFDVESTHVFRAPPLKTVSLTATCYEQGGPTTPLEDRPRIRWREDIR
jgi:hypothetical protein